MQNKDKSGNRKQNPTEELCSSSAVLSSLYPHSSDGFHCISPLHFHLHLLFSSAVCFPASSLLFLLHWLYSSALLSSLTPFPSAHLLGSPFFGGCPPFRVRSLQQGRLRAFVRKTASLHHHDLLRPAQGGGETACRRKRSEEAGKHTSSALLFFPVT